MVQHYYISIDTYNITGIRGSTHPRVSQGSAPAARARSSDYMISWYGILCYTILHYAILNYSIPYQSIIYYNYSIL